MNIWIKSVCIALVATSVSYIGAFYSGWITPGALDFLEVAAVFLTYINVFMCVHQTRWNYPVGIVSTLLYSYLFYKWEMYAVGAFNLYLVFSLTYGWFRWGPDSNRRPVTRIDAVGWGLYTLLGVLILGLLQVVNTYFDYNITNAEIFITVFSGVAQFMLDNKKLENWFFWILVNVVSIWFFFHGELYLVTCQYAFFLLNAFYGWYMWYKDHQFDVTYKRITDKLIEPIVEDKTSYGYGAPD